MKHNYILFIGTAIAVLGAVACNKEHFEEPAPAGDVIAFSSFRKQVYTKADIQLFDFAPGTKYTLLAVSAGENRWESGKGFATQPQIGTESSIHTIAYEPTSVFRSGENLDFFGLTYGTETAPELISAPLDGTAPVIEIAEVNDRLPDLMHSNDPEARNRNSAGGTVLLPFEHALSAVNILLSKQDETADEAAAKQLLDVRVTDLTLKNVAESAQMDVVTGAWTWITTGNRTIYHDPEGYAANETAEYLEPQDLLLVPSSDQQISLSISLSGIKSYNASTQQYELINKTLAGGEQVVDGAVTLESPLRRYDQTGADAGPLIFERNHKYTLAVTILRDNVRIVSISPQVYEWVDVNISGQAAVLGQPVTFGGVVWMDRNLGATGFDCENDFLNTMGYYYQFSRNIPYIFNRTVWNSYKNNRNVFMPDVTEGANGRYTYDGSLSTFWTLNTTDLSNVQPVTNGDIRWGGVEKAAKNVFDRHTANKRDNASPRNTYQEGTFGIHTANATEADRHRNALFFTYDENGEKVDTWRTGFRYLSFDPAAQTDKTLYPAINPGDPGGYSFSIGPRNKGNQAWSWSRDDDEPMPNWTAYRDYWGDDNSNPENQPAPKGWKIASHKEIYTILPEVRVTGWVDDKAYFYQAATSHEMTGDPTAAQYVGEYDFQYVAGRIRLPAQGANPGLKNLLHSTSYLPVVYGIKHQGTDQAYLIKIEQRESKEPLFRGSNGKQYYFNYVVISRYPATREDRILTDLNTTDPQEKTVITKTNLQDFDWSHPAAELYFPMQGYLDAGASPSNENGNFRGPFLAEFGLSCIMRVTSWTGANSPGHNHTFYFRNSGVGSNTGSRNALGDPIRLIRDFSAK